MHIADAPAAPKSSPCHLRGNKGGRHTYIGVRGVAVRACTQQGAVVHSAGQARHERGAQYCVPGEA
eukprot:scaffold68996_cov59-Phaeocystis_antarctica.AAC.3